MISLEWIFLPAIILLGVVTSYQDFKFGKIKNKWIILALIYALIVYVIGILFYNFYGDLNIEYIIELSTNFLFAIFVGFGLWITGIWTAGDGKLFIAYATLIPLSMYSLGYYKYTPSLTLLINIFVLAVFILLIPIFLKIKFKDIRKISIDFLKEFFKPSKLFNSVIGLFAIFWIVQLLLSFLGLKNVFILKLICSFLIFAGIESRLKGKSVYLILIICFLRLILDKSVYSLDFLYNFLMIILIWGFVKSFLNGGLSKFGENFFVKEVFVEKLRPGMVLEEIIIKKGKISKKELIELQKSQDIGVIRYLGENYLKKVKSFQNLESFLGGEPEGLTHSQIKKIQDMGIKKIKVSSTIPFAPFMFLGVIITLIVRSNILLFLKGLF
ncbi:MAG: hypothetical protein KJ646_01870 [Nanoarchaeota archaeon]|nr:hypothetical protein [Nanoarchaeota archaeon]MBU4116831.1 hypothetical protein [Nanoarchaeota archaeon]MBU4580785.1 hypothetical protein [Patescibacteria group bacterium]